MESVSPLLFLMLQYTMRVEQEQRRSKLMPVEAKKGKRIK